jgi:hypothetical protein
VPPLRWEIRASTTWKQTVFAEPLRELKKMKSEWVGTHVELQNRIAHAKARMGQAVKAGLNFDQVARLGKPFLDPLVGDGAAHIGLLHDTTVKIDRAIALMEGFTASQLHNERHVWCAWPNLPSRINDGIRAAERLVDELENLTTDNGHIAQLLRALAASKTGQAVA